MTRGIRPAWYTGGRLRAASFTALAVAVLGSAPATAAVVTGSPGTAITAEAHICPAPGDPQGGPS